MPRILMLSQFFPPYIGGEERMVFALSAGLAARGHSVAVATLGRPGLAECETVEGVRVYRLRSTTQRLSFLYSASSHQHAPPLPDPELVQGLWRVSQLERPEIVHAHNWIIHSYLPLKPTSRARLVLHLHDYSLACATKKLIYRHQPGPPCTGPGLLKCLGCVGHQYGQPKGAITHLANMVAAPVERRLIDHTIAVSQAVADGNALARHGLPFSVVPNFMIEPANEAVSDWSAYLAQLPADDFIMYAGAFGSYKGIDVLLAAYRQLDEAPPLVIVGYTSNEYPVATTDLPPNVTVLRDWPHGAVMAAWRRCLFAVVPSVWAETFGLVVIEPMSVGRPVIASRIGGLPDTVIDGQNGLLVEPGDVAMLSAAMARLSSEHGLRSRLGQQAQQHAQRFTMGAVLPQIEAIYGRLALPS